MATKSSRSSGTQHNKRGVTQGTTLVDPIDGFPVCVKKDGAGDYRLCVDGTFTLSAAELEVNLDVDNDGVHIGDLTTGDVLVVNPDGSINVNVAVDAKDGDNIAVSAHPEADQIFAEAANTLTNDSPKTIFSYTSSSDNTRIIKLDCVSFTQTIFRLKIDGTTKKIKVSSAGNPNIEFLYIEHRPLLNGEVLTIEAEASRYFGNNGPYETFTSLEGYLCS